MTRPARLLLAVVLMVLAVAQGAALRATWHPAPHPGGDNAGYVALADALRDGAGYTEVWDPAAPPHTKYPPVFPALLAVAMAAGARTWAGLKVVPLLFAGLAVAGTFLWARARRGPLWGLSVALLTGWSAALLYHAHYVLSDVPFLAFTMGALWLLEDRRSAASVPEAPTGAAQEVADGGADPGDPARAGSVALACAVALAGLAYFTRSAGLPLVVAGLVVLVLRRRFVAALVAAGALGVPAALWLLRARGAVTDGAYAREFWMVDPYRPAAGEIGLGGLVPRALENAGGYLGGHLPTALFGPGSAWTVAGVAVGLLAVVGWGRAVRERVGAAELFAPLYGALVLVWPVVWSGDRFALPLVPLVLLYAGEAAGWLVGRVREGAVRPVLAAGFAVLLLGEGAALAGASQESAACRGATRAGGPWACSGIGMVQFTEAARWAGANLPDDAATLTRKPRIWYVMGGGASRTYPFVPDPDSVLAVAARAGASYVVLDLVGAQAQLLANAIGARPSAFCSVAGFGGDGGQPRTELLGILPGAAAPAPAARETIRVGSCPDALRGRGPALEPYSSSSSIPILTSKPSPSP